MTADTTNIPISREELKVVTQWTETGKVRISKTVHELPQQVESMLGEESVDIERIPMDQLVDEPPAARYEGDTLVVPILEEVLVVEKRFRIKEELRITKSRRDVMHSTTVPVRVEEAIVERIDEQVPPTQPSVPN
jgi:uncharacterized protein (TIGR02271 family)